MKQRLFRFSVMVYFVGLFCALFLSLSVPPRDLPIWIALIGLAACALLASKGRTRRWRIACVAFLVIALLGTALEVVSGMAIKRRMEQDRGGAFQH
jgi:Sec-independent protein secretion pathway component TatC